MLLGGIFSFHLSVTIAPCPTSYGGREDIPGGSCISQSLNRRIQDTGRTLRATLRENDVRYINRSRFFNFRCHLPLLRAQPHTAAMGIYQKIRRLATHYIGRFKIMGAHCLRRIGKLTAVISMCVVFNFYCHLPLRRTQPHTATNRTPKMALGLALLRPVEIPESM